ncbi:MAG: hypothetical protein JW927_02660 [Deltaproteobacteria bacterium]|nr:hypothetical protein [Deltaproteobacteria bacterium]
MSLLNIVKEGYGGIKTVITDNNNNTVEGPTLIYEADRKRNWSVLYLIVAIFVGSIVFIFCWVYAYLSWGFPLGICVGWIPSLFIGIIAGLIWPMVVFILIVYLLSLRYRGMI